VSGKEDIKNVKSSKRGEFVRDTAQLKHSRLPRNMSRRLKSPEEYAEANKQTCRGLEVQTPREVESL
jgi:hypothetical protein